MQSGLMGEKILPLLMTETFKVQKFKKMLKYLNINSKSIGSEINNSKDPTGQFS